jgi:hypothetical protein
MALAAMFFIFALIDLVRSERLTVELFIKFFGNFAIAWGMILAAPTLYTATVNFGNTLGQWAAEVWSGLSGSSFNIPSKSDFYNNLAYYVQLDKSDPEYQSWISLFPTALVTAGPLVLVCLGLTVATYFIAFSRLIELAVRGAFLPIAFGCMSDDGFRGAGGRYLRKFIAICAQVAVLVTIANVTTYIMGTVGSIVTSTFTSSAHLSLKSMISAAFIMVGVGFASVSVMMKSIGLTNDIFGA